MTREDAIHDLMALKEAFEEQNGAYPICLEYAIRELSEQKENNVELDYWKSMRCRYER